MKKEKLTFEQAMLRLEEVVEALESGSPSLESAMELFAEGAELTAYLEKTLQTAKLKMEKLFPEQVEAALGKDGRPDVTALGLEGNA